MHSLRACWWTSRCSRETTLTSKSLHRFSEYVCARICARSVKVLVDIDTSFVAMICTIMFTRVFNVFYVFVYRDCKGSMIVFLCILDLAN